MEFDFNFILFPAPSSSYTTIISNGDLIFIPKARRKKQIPMKSTLKYFCC